MTNQDTKNKSIKNKKRNNEYAKYCYVIANKENGDLLIRSAELPFFWLRQVAKKHCKGFKGYVVHKILLEDIQTLVLRSKPLTKTLKTNKP